MYKTFRFYDYPDYSVWLDAIQQTKRISIVNITSHRTYAIVTYIEEEIVNDQPTA